jgi:flavodoxin I
MLSAMEQTRTGPDMKIAIIYGSTTGNTEAAAERLKDALSDVGEVTLANITEGLDAAADADVVLLGASTWGMGDMQDDWVGYEDLDGLDLTDKRVAVFGMGDQTCYDNTFVEAIGVLADAATKAGGTLIGAWATDGYECTESFAIRDGKFVGLPLDEDNQSELTQQRIADWAAQLKQEITA